MKPKHPKLPNQAKGNSLDKKKLSKELDGDGWSCLSSDHPELAYLCKWKKLDWASLLAHRPEFIAQCDLTKLDDEDWDWILRFQPQLIKCKNKSMNEAKLYYTPPADEQFNEIREKAIELWKEIDTDNDKYGYASEKIVRIKDIANVGDNFMYIFAMFHPVKRRKLISRLSSPTVDSIRERIIDGGGVFLF
jgi:hypothetical protein